MWLSILLNQALSTHRHRGLEFKFCIFICWIKGLQMELSTLCYFGGAITFVWIYFIELCLHAKLVNNIENQFCQSTAIKKRQIVNLTILFYWIEFSGYRRYKVWNDYGKKNYFRYKIKENHFRRLKFLIGIVANCGW